MIPFACPIVYGELKYVGPSIRRLVGGAVLAGLLAAAPAGCGGSSSRESSPMPPAPTPTPTPTPTGPTATQQDFIEALFLGSGPFTPQGNVNPNFACPNKGSWSAFPEGSTVTVIVPRRITGINRAAIESTVTRTVEATVGKVRATIVDTDDLNATPQAGLFVMAVVPLEQIKPYCGSGASIACITYERYPVPGGVFTWSKAFFSMGDPVDTNHPNPFAHELAHGMLGMCHIESSLVGGDGASVMNGFVGLSPKDMDALKAVYGSALRPGATRTDFVAAGLVRP